MENLSKIKSIQTILVTSTRSFSDNSSMAAELAIIIAQSGKKVALIDADLRQPIIHNIFNLSNHVGLCDLLSSQRATSSVIHSVINGNLSVLPSGKLPNGSMDVLCTKRMSEILTGIKQEYDTLMIQAPPFFYPETSHLATQVDGVVLLIHPGYSKSETLRMIIERFQKSGAITIGIVIRDQPKYQGNQSVFLDRLLNYNKQTTTSV